MSARPLVVFAIPTRDRPESLLALLDALDALRVDEPLDRRIVVWDDASGPATRQALRASRHWGRPDLDVHLSDVQERMRVKRRLDDLAFALARGREEAYVAHLDDDVRPAPGWLVRALQALRRHGWAGCGSVERVDGGWVLSGQRDLDLTSVRTRAGEVRVWTWRRHHVDPDDQDGATEVAFAGHRAMLVRAEAVAAVPHDPGFAIGGEDLDWSLSLRRAGHRLGIAHGARIEHRTRDEEDAPGFRDPALVVSSWERFHARWGFVRDGAAEEAGMPREAWLEHFAAAAKVRGS